MKTLHAHWKVPQRVTFTQLHHKLALGSALASLLWGGAVNVVAQTDNFSDGNDTANPPWTHSSIALTAPTWDASGFNYRLRSAVGPLGIGYAASFVAPNYSDFLVQLDLVDWASNGGQAFGVSARAGDINVTAGLDGYAFGYDLRNGSFVITRIANAGVTTLISAPVALDAAKDYQFVFAGSGSALHALAFEIGGPASPIVDLTATDATYASGLSGVFGFSVNGQMTDFTVDNFVAAVPEPHLVSLAALGVAGLLVGRRFCKSRG